MENYFSYLDSNNKKEQAIPFLEDLVKDNEDRVVLRRALADQYQQAGQTEDAIAQLDAIGELLVEEGKKNEAAEVIQQILLMNPPNAEEYRTPFSNNFKLNNSIPALMRGFSLWSFSVYRRTIKLIPL